jgi:hypothetical protein
LAGRTFLKYVKPLKIKIMYETFSDSVGTYREGIRNGLWVIDKVLTSIGFAGVQNTDWTNILTIN